MRLCAVTGTPLPVVVVGADGIPPAVVIVVLFAEAGAASVTTTSSSLNYDIHLHIKSVH